VLSDEGTHMLLSLFYKDLITTILKTGGFSFSKAYDFSLSYLIHYPKLQVFYPPLYHIFTGLFFYSLFGVSPFTARLSNFLFGIASIILIYYFSSNLIDKKSGFISAIIFSLNPIVLSVIMLAMKDFLAILFSLLTMILFFLSLKKKKNSYFFIVGIISALAILSDVPAATVYVTIFITLLLKKKIKELIIFVISSALLLLPYAILIIKIGGIEINAIRYSMYSFFANFVLEEFILILPIMIILFISFVYYYKKKKLFYKEILIWFLISFVVANLISIKSRFFLFFLLPLFIVSGFWLSKGKKLLVGLLIYSFIISVYLVRTYYFPTYPVNEITEFIHKNLPARLNVALLTEKDGALYSSSFIFPQAMWDKNKTVMFLRPCYFWNKTKEEKINTLKDSGVYFVIAIKNTAEYGNVTQIKDRLDKVYEKGIIEVYKFKDYQPTNKICNFVCTTNQLYCTKYNSPFDIYS